MFAEFFRDPIRLVYTNENIFSSVCRTLLLLISCFFREDLTIEKRKFCMSHAHFGLIHQLNLFWSGLLRMALALSSAQCHSQSKKNMLQVGFLGCFSKSLASGIDGKNGNCQKERTYAPSLKQQQWQSIYSSKAAPCQQGPS